MKTSQKGFIAPLILIIALLVLGGGAYVYTQQKPINPPVTENVALPQATSISATSNQTTGIAVTSPKQIENWKSNSENTVSIFLKNVNIRGYGDNMNIAFAQLTANAQAVVKANSPNTTPDGLAYGLAYLVTVQAGPEKTTIISSEKLNDGTVKILTQWYYYGTPSPRTFVLVLENGQWKIDKVQTN
jgi:hypothetical protein